MKFLLFALMLALTLTGCSGHGSATPVSERSGEVMLKGKPLRLWGERVEVGQRAPDFVAVGRDMRNKKFSDYAGKTVILSVVPSVDTKVCAIQTRKFNEQATALGKDVVVLTVSKDLPMAQSRFCAAEGIEQVVMLSDYRGNFGAKWGLEIVETGLLARAIYVIDQSGKVVYEQIVPELTQEPDYTAALAAAKG